MSETILSILAKAPRKAYAYLLIFVITEIIELGLPVPRTGVARNINGIVIVGGAIALSLFLKLLPLRITLINRTMLRAI